MKFDLQHIKNLVGMKDTTGQYAAVRGKIKYKGVESGSGDYKTGKLEVEPKKDHWRLNVCVITKRDGPIISFRLDQKAIKSLIKKSDRVIVDLTTGFTIYMIADNSDLGSLLRVQEMLTSIKEGTAEHAIRESKAEVGGIKHSRSMSELSSPRTNSPEVSPKFTSNTPATEPTPGDSASASLAVCMPPTCSTCTRSEDKIQVERKRRLQMQVLEMQLEYYRLHVEEMKKKKTSE